MKQLVVPRINLNGNTAKDLVTRLRAVLDDLRLVERSMRDAGDIVHPRNFQTYGDSKKEQELAAEAWMERRVAINDMLRDFMELACDIAEQEDLKHGYPRENKE